MHGVLLRRISDQCTAFVDKLQEIQTDLQTMKVTKAVLDKSESTQLERFKEWLKFWGPVILASLALIVPLAKLTFDNWDKIMPIFHHEKLSAQKMGREIAKERKGPRGKAVRKKEAALERAAKGLPPEPLNPPVQSGSPEEP